MRGHAGAPGDNSGELVLVLGDEVLGGEEVEEAAARLGGRLQVDSPHIQAETAARPGAGSSSAPTHRPARGYAIYIVRMLLNT